MTGSHKIASDLKSQGELSRRRCIFAKSMPSGSSKESVYAQAILPNNTFRVYPGTLTRCHPDAKHCMMHMHIKLYIYIATLRHRVCCIARIGVSAKQPPGFTRQILHHNKLSEACTLNDANENSCTSVGHGPERDTMRRNIVLQAR